jgi:hypothetical protein
MHLRDTQMDNDILLADAIRHREQVHGTYNGRRRSFCPHALGTKEGKRHVLVYQFSGEGLSGAPLNSGWRCLDVEKLTDLSATEGEWHTATNIFNPQSCLDEVEVVIQPFPPRVRIADAEGYAADDLSP